MKGSILIFVDGLGLGKKDRRSNPCMQDHLNYLNCFENGRSTISIESGGFLVPTDANLGLSGIPQSATGQATILTGVNCSRLLGFHRAGFPNEMLRNLLRQRSLLKQVKDMGLKVSFINAFRPIFFRLNEKTKWRLSTTTVATLSAGLDFFQIDDINKRRSIYHDFTNYYLIKRGFDVPLFTPDEAAAILAEASSKYHFILYEYFLTDRAGHAQDLDFAKTIIRQLDEFITSLLTHIDLNDKLIILTSDHGNIEDLSVKTHTKNSAMTLIWGRNSVVIKDYIRSLEDITPAILNDLQNSYSSTAGEK